MTEWSIFSEQEHHLQNGVVDEQYCWVKHYLAISMWPFGLYVKFAENLYNEPTPKNRFC